MKIKAILGAWLVVAVLMVCNGMLRVAVLAPLFGVETAETMSVLLGIIIVFGASKPFLSPHAPQSLMERWRVSLVWIATTIVFEVTLGRMGGRSWSEIAGAYAFWSGSLWPLILIAVGLAPHMWLARPYAPVTWRLTK